ncbi:transporter substrate-binding domain-containing protein [uncultured Deinococcus sp.]|uniref:transporter substrate-binding domain-containing protein n=1 Tax=uncultured Deinococcus sp. TaxID=158789 RepID=UPI00258A3C91|nr:transporter substrate-binding domain-containing protein [uncultured Deinococcus sp.]
MTWRSGLRMAGALALLGLASGASADQLADIRKAGVLRVGVPQDFAPFGSVGPDLKPRGYDIDVATILAKGLNVSLELVPVASANRLPYLQTGKIDLIVSSLGKNAEREKVIDFSVPYAPFYSAVFGVKDMGVRSAADLAGHSVGVTRGSIEDLELTKMLPAGVNIKRYEDNATTITAFLTGQTELVATGNTVAATIAERSPRRKPVQKFVIKDSPCYVGLNKNEAALLKQVNKILTTYRSNGYLDRLSQQWFKSPLPASMGRS